MSCPCCPSCSDIKRIKIGDQEIGIMGFDFIMRAGLEVKDRPESEIKEVLLGAMKVSNYISKSVEKEYLEAIWQEFLKYNSM